MKKKILKIVLVILGLFGFILVLGGVGRAEIDPHGFLAGTMVAIGGLLLLFFVIIGYFFYNRI